MKIYCIALVLIIFTFRGAVCQSFQTDSLKRLLVLTGQDTNRVSLLIEIASAYRYFNPDSSLLLAQQALALSKKLNFNKGKVRTLIIYGEARRFRGDFPQALEAQFEALQTSKNSRFPEGEENSLGLIGMIYQDLNEYRQALNYLYQAKKFNESLSNKNVGGICRWLSSIGYIYEKMNMLDSALFFQKQAHAYLNSFPVSTVASLVLTRLGVIQSRLGYRDLALQYFQEALKITYATGDMLNRSRAQYRIAELYHSANKPDSSLHYCRLAFANGNTVFLKSTILDASNLLVKLYKEKNNLDSALHYQEVAMATKELMYGREKFQQLQLLTLTQQQRQQQLREKQVQLQRIGLVSALAVFLFIALLLWRNIRYQKLTNRALHFKNEQIETQKNTLENTLMELKGTQAQLIQSEKMASLGELTAGIAHEIQNPLNFVNNFSEVSTELVDEMEVALQQDDKEEAVAIASDIKDNLQKINHHGKRAGDIVKGMLQHSRTSSSQKEPTDINKLADEYLRLAFHGLRAKDKSFNAILKTDYDEAIGNINIIPQDVGRVILNLINNAFYAVGEKKKSPHPLKGGIEYEPVVAITTKKLGSPPTGGDGGIEIRVRDNGNGIPQKILDKIFQPFFTTKPTGQGTGLGLSLSYDIIKAHGGELKVETKEGEGSEFIILL
jgi:signal transduction histidine kinase